jgi:hypothetical protein
MTRLRSVVIAVVCLAATGCMARIGPYDGERRRGYDDGRQQERGHDKDRRHGGDDRREGRD